MMKTSPLSLLHTASHAALSDELLKIAQEAQAPKPAGFKRWVKNTALIGAGYGLGHGTAHLLDEKVLRPLVGEKWKKWNSPRKAGLMRAFMGITAAGGMLAAENLAYQRWKAQHEQ